MYKLPQAQNLTRILDKIEVFERICPGATIPRDQEQVFLADDPFVGGEFDLDVVDAFNGDATIRIDLAGLSKTFESWVEAQIEKYSPTALDGEYNRFCPVHGKVQTGTCVDDLDSPEAQWLCPECGHNEECDDWGDDYEHWDGAVGVSFGRVGDEFCWGASL